VVAGWKKDVIGALMRLNSSFLQADKIRLLFCQPLKKAFSGGSADTVDV
jgi:hypothetical protein